MKQSRPARSSRDRKAHLSADAERLVTGALGMANSGSRVEDRFWEAQIAARLEAMLDDSHPQALYDALDRLHQTDLEAYGALVETVEEVAESLVVEVDGQTWQILLVAAPVVAWTRFNIPAGPIAAPLARSIAGLWRDHVLMPEARFFMAPAVYSVDQLPRDYGELRKLTRRLGMAAVRGNDTKSIGRLPESAEMLADARFFVGAVAVPSGGAVFQWQAVDLRNQGGRVQALERWVEHARELVEQVLPGCGFECLLPDAYHLNMRESDRRVRPFNIRASVHFLTHALAVEASQIHAIIAAFGGERIDEYRVGLAIDADGEEIAHGVMWPLLGAESETDDPSPLDQIRQHLVDAGVNKIHVWRDVTEPEYCEDCGAPLYPNNRGDLMHAELPNDVAPESVHFH